MCTDTNLVYEKSFVYGFFTLSLIAGLIIYVVLIFAFTFFWSNLQLNVKDISERLAKENSFVPGIRQGKETQKYLKRNKK